MGKEESAKVLFQQLSGLDKSYGRATKKSKSIIQPYKKAYKEIYTFYSGWVRTVRGEERMIYVLYNSLPSDNGYSWKYSTFIEVK